MTHPAGPDSGTATSPESSRRNCGRPGLDIYGNGRACDTDTGSFDVRDLATSGSKITRLDVLYTQYCDAGPGALFGEIRIGEPQPGGLVVSSSSITWPPTGAGRITAVPLCIRNRGRTPVPVGRAALTGYAAGGTTSLMMKSQPDDFVEQGKNWSYTAANAVTGLLAGHKYTIVVYTVDRYGSVSKPAERVVSG